MLKPLVEECGNSYWHATTKLRPNSRDLDCTRKKNETDLESQACSGWKRIVLRRCLIVTTAKHSVVSEQVWEYRLRISLWTDYWYATRKIQTRSDVTLLSVLTIPHSNARTQCGESRFLTALLWLAICFVLSIHHAIV